MSTFRSRVPLDTRTTSWQCVCVCEATSTCTSNTVSISVGSVSPTAFSTSYTVCVPVFVTRSTDTRNVAGTDRFRDTHRVSVTIGNTFDTHSPLNSLVPFDREESCIEYPENTHACDSLVTHHHVYGSSHSVLQATSHSYGSDQNSTLHKIKIIMIIIIIILRMIFIVLLYGASHRLCKSSLWIIWTTVGQRQVAANS